MPQSSRSITVLNLSHKKCKEHPEFVSKCLYEAVTVKHGGNTWPPRLFKPTWLFKETAFKTSYRQKKSDSERQASCVFLHMEPRIEGRLSGGTKETSVQQGGSKRGDGLNVGTV